MSIPVFLSYDFLIQKALREIERLRQAENDLDVTTAMDHALNAALTVYHLLEWRQNPTGLSKEKLKDVFDTAGKKIKSAHDLCAEVDTPEIYLLHGIVTHTKHVTVSTPMPNKDTAADYIPAYDDDIEYMETENGDKIGTESDLFIVTENSKITILFGSDIALNVLETVMQTFGGERSS